MKPGSFRLVLQVGVLCSCSLLMAQTPVATLSCQSPSASLTLALLEDSVDFTNSLYSSGSGDFAIAADLTELPGLLAASISAPTYDTCAVTGGAIAYTMTGVTLSGAPSFSEDLTGFLYGGSAPYVVAVATFGYKTLTLAGVTVSGSASKPSAAKAKDAPQHQATLTQQRAIATSNREVTK